MKIGLLNSSLLVLTLTNWSFLAPEKREQPRYSQAATPVPQPYVQVTSVTVEPSTIHNIQKSSTATVVVQILLQGEAPPDQKITLEVGTFSSNPPNNELEYDHPTRSVSLQEGVTVEKIKVVTTRKTVEGKIKIKALISAAPNGVNIKAPESPEDSLGELTVVGT
jgi:hypothetical protein